MPGVGNVFVSHASDDNKLCIPLLAALDAWEIPYYFDATAPTEPQLSPAAQKALTESQVFIRVCTAATNRSISMGLESNAFRGLQAAKKRGGTRILINLILDAAYQREPFDNATLFIDATSMSRFDWMSQLARALGITTVSRRLSRRSALGLGVASAVALASATSAGVAIARDKQTSAQPVKDPTQRISALTSQAKWTYTGAGRESIPLLASSAGSVLYIYSDLGLQAVNGSDKRQLWNTSSIQANSYSSSFNPAPLTLANGVLYVIDGSGYLSAVNANNGQSKWKLQVATDMVSATLGAPAVADNTVYLMQDDAKLHAYKASDGSALWSAAVGNQDVSDSIWPAAAGANGLVYIGSSDHNLYALSASDGSVKWKYLTRGAIYSTPAVADGIVYFGSEDAYVYALDARTGKLLWRYQTDYDIHCSPTVANGVVYIGSHDDYLYAFDAKKGTAFWRAFAGDLDPAGFNTKGYRVDSQPVVDTYAVYVTAGSYIFAFNIRDGKRLWRFKSGGDDYGNTSSPAVGAGLVYFAASDYTVYAINT